MNRRAAHWGFAVAIAMLPACSSMRQNADPASGAPESRFSVAALVEDARSYDEALALWRSVEDVNAWVGARFEYDRARAMLLSETQRQRAGRIAIHAPDVFFEQPSGVCVDLARFAVETLRRIDPQARPVYLMIEFSPVTVAGNTLRRHWLVSYERQGQRYFFADSKRPGYIAGPYATTEEFVRDYAAYRGRNIVAFQERASYERSMRVRASRQSREPRP